MSRLPNPDREVDLRAEVLASPAYQERTGVLFELFVLSRQLDRRPESLLSLQAALAEILRDWQGRRREFQHKDNLVEVAVVNRLILVLKRIADSIAWRALQYDRLLIQLLAEHPKTGFLEDTVIEEFQAADRIVKAEGAIVLVNDLTTVLKYGDLTVICPDGSMKILEVKTGRKDGRAIRQKRNLRDLLDFLNTGSRVSRSGTKDYTFRLDVPVQTHHREVAELIAEARRNGYAVKIISNCLAVEAIWLEHPNPYLPNSRPFANTEHILISTNLDVFDKPAPRLVPYGVFPFDNKSCFDLISGSTYLIATLNFDALMDLFHPLGLALELPLPNQREIEDYLSASIGEISKSQKQMTDRHLWFRFRDGRNCLRMSPDNWARITIELLHESTFAQAVRCLMDQVSRSDGVDDELERLYWGFKDESRVWH